MEALTIGASWSREGRVTLLSPAFYLAWLLCQMHFSEVFLPFCLGRASCEIHCWESCSWGVLLCHGCRNSWENEHRVPHTHSLPASVARASRMLLDKHHLCGHTLFYELSHQPGWLLKRCCLNLQAEANKMAWSAIWQNFIEGQSHLPKVMRDLPRWSLRPIKGLLINFHFIWEEIWCFSAFLIHYLGNLFHYSYF